jgi:ribose transport system substrate-binding protein
MHDRPKPHGPPPRLAGRIDLCAWLLCACAWPGLSVAQAPPVTAAEAQRTVQSASQRTTAWTGPRTGPVASGNRTIVVIAEDLRNGGVVGVAQGVREAAQVLGWTVRIVNAGGSASGRTRAFAAALAMAPDGIVLCGVDAVEDRVEVARFSDRALPLVGWHSAPLPGPIADPPVAMNVTTDPLEVARVTALAAVAESGGHAGVVIFTDSRYRIATSKSDAMSAVVRACAGCTLLEVRDVPLSDASVLMPGITKELLRRYGKRWTHALSINDVVFDHAVSTLTRAGVASHGLSLLSAGDGSASAFLRIEARTFQTATVAEPLNEQGWQLLDELNRLFEGEPVSSFVAPVHLVTASSVALNGGERLQYDPDNGYRAAYRRIWKR